MLDTAIVVFVFLSTLIFHMKPTLFFKFEGGHYKLRDYGLGKKDGYKKTLFNLHTFTIVLAVFSYVVSKKI